MDAQHTTLAGDILFKVVENLNYKDLTQLCSTDVKIHDYCQRKAIPLWQYMVKRDFPNRHEGLGLDKLYSKNPKELYQLLLKRSKVITIYVENSDLDTLDLTFNVENLIENGLVILPGDIIKADDRKYIWDGFNVLSLGYESKYDETGYVPSSFAYPDYPVDHFFDAIDHNYIFWIREDIAKQFHKDLKDNKITLYDDILDQYAVLDFIKEDFDDVYYTIDEDDIIKYFGDDGNPVNPERDLVRTNGKYTYFIVMIY